MVSASVHFFTLLCFRPYSTFEVCTNANINTAQSYIVRVQSVFCSSYVLSFVRSFIISISRILNKHRIFWRLIVMLLNGLLVLVMFSRQLLPCHRGQNWPSWLSFVLSVNFFTVTATLSIRAYPVNSYSTWFKTSSSFVQNDPIFNESATPVHAFQNIPLSTCFLPVTLTKLLFVTTFCRHVYQVFLYGAHCCNQITVFRIPASPV